MNSKITSFNFNNCPNLKRIYISPTCEIEGQIDLSNTPIRKRLKYDEHEEGDEGVIITSDRIFKKYARLGKETIIKEIGTDDLDDLNIEQLKKRIKKLEQEKNKLARELEKEKNWWDKWEKDHEREKINLLSDTALELGKHEISFEISSSHLKSNGFSEFVVDWGINFSSEIEEVRKIIRCLSEYYKSQE